MTDQLTEVQETKPTFVAYVKSFFRSVGNFFFRSVGNFFIKYPLTIAATLLLIVVASVMAIFGQSIQIGNLLSKLWGKAQPRELPDSPVVTPPPGRVDENGKPIEPGKSDDKGYVQTPVLLPIKDPGVFSDPTTVVVVTPEGKDVTIPLPTGVKNRDVKEVIMVAPNVYQIANKDTGVDAGKILEDITK